MILRKCLSMEEGRGIIIEVIIITVKTFKPDRYQKHTIEISYLMDKDVVFSTSVVITDGVGKVVLRNSWNTKLSKTEAYMKSKAMIDERIKDRKGKTIIKSSVSAKTPTTATKATGKEYTTDTIIFKGLKINTVYEKNNGIIIKTHVNVKRETGDTALTYHNWDGKINKSEAQKWAKEVIIKNKDSWIKSDKTKSIETIVKRVCGAYIGNDDTDPEDIVQFRKSGTQLRFSAHLITGDRGPRQDHGGEDGDSWMGSSELARVSKPFYDKWRPRARDLQSKLTAAGIKNARVDVEYGEKGHVFLEVTGNA